MEPESVIFTLCRQIFVEENAIVAETVVPFFYMTELFKIIGVKNWYKVMYIVGESCRLLIYRRLANELAGMTIPQ